MATPRQLTMNAVPGIPLLARGDDLGLIIIGAMQRAHLLLADGDIIAIAQKVVSKAEGRFVELGSIVPSSRALQVAAKVSKDPRLVEVILSESVRIVREQPGVLIVEHRDGFIMANAGVDRSNVSSDANGEMVLLLPRKPDESARKLRAQFEEHSGKRLGVIISDSFGRPWRQGTVGIALGASGVEALKNLRGQPDLFGRLLEVSETAHADEIASAASLLMGQANEGHPVVIVSGLGTSERDLSAAALLRPANQDLFR